MPVDLVHEAVDLFHGFPFRKINSDIQNLLIFYNLVRALFIYYFPDPFSIEK
jgi:hypothetical protein